MESLIYIYKILSLGLAYPEERNWAMIDKHIMTVEGFLEDVISTRVDNFKKNLSKYQQKIEEIRADYLSIFDTGRKISPYETEYMSEKVSRKPFELADIAGFYTAFGFDVKEDIRNKEALDHISIELEFMAILSWKAVYAREMKQDENLRIVQDARMKFFKEHLANWTFFYCQQVCSLSESDFFKGLAAILQLVLNIECERYMLDVSLFDREMVREPYSGVRSDELTCSNLK